MIQPYALFHQLEGLEVEVGCIQLSQAAQKLGFGSPPLPDGDHCHDKVLDDAANVICHLVEVEHEEAKNCITDKQFSSLLRKYGGKKMTLKKIIGSSRKNPHHMVTN